jgi:hypothetical protein
MTLTGWMAWCTGIDRLGGLLRCSLTCGVAQSSSHLIYQVRAAEVSGKRDLWESPQWTAAWQRSEAIMASLVIIALVLTLAGVIVGAFIMISIAIRREDRRTGSLRFDAPSNSTRVARSLVGISSSRWD